MNTSISCRAVGKTYPTRTDDLVVLEEVNLSLGRGQAAAIMGPSGSGKSTLLNILGTLEPPTTGHVVIETQDPFSLSEPDLARFRNRHIGFIFQDHHLLPQCSAIENILLPALAQSSPKASGADEAAHTLLEAVGLDSRGDHLPGELSGGEKQRVAIARALINKPSIILADEPTGNLDSKNAAEIGELLCRLLEQESVTLLVVTHSERLASLFSTRYELIAGRLNQVGGS